MKQTILSTLLCTSLMCHAELYQDLRTAINAVSAPAKVKAFTAEKLLPVCVNSVIVAEVTAQNARNVPLDEIKQIDEAWKTAEEELPIHEEKVSNKCAAELIRLLKDIPAVTEVFVMDNQGANVGQNTLTSDYWQGDEAKWQNSFKNGKGGVEFGEQEFDKSANSVIQQISLPVISQNGTVIGAVCFGIKPNSI